MTKKLRLLIVDDSRASREELGTLLSEESYIREIWMAKHGLEALSLAEKHHPDVVLLDQNMPGLTGAEVARRLKATDSNTRIIFVSADPEAQELAMAAGAEAFYVKGVNTAGLIQALRVAHSPPRRRKRSFKLLWLFAYWWFGHGWLLEPDEEYEGAEGDEPFLRDVHAERAKRPSLRERLTSWRKMRS